MREKRVNKINMGGEDYELAPNKIFFAGDSWDRGIEYMVEPAITANTNGSITLNCSTHDVMIGSTTLANAIDESPTATHAMATVNSAVDRLDSLESSVNYIQADTNSLYEQLKNLNKKLDALSLAYNQKKTGKRTLADLIEPGEAEWIEKMNLKTRRTGTFRKSELLTI